MTEETPTYETENDLPYSDEPEQDVTADAMAEETMIHDLMDLVLDDLKASGAWAEMNQDAQDEVIARAEIRVKTAVGKAIDIINAQEAVKARGIVEQVVFKDGAKVVITGKNNPQFHEIAYSTGEEVMIVLATADNLLEQEHEHESDPDQAEVPFPEAA